MKASILIILPLLSINLFADGHEVLPAGTHGGGTLGGCIGTIKNVALRVLLGKKYHYFRQNIV